MTCLYPQVTLMKYLMLLFVLFFIGCGLSPRMNNELENQNGKIEELKQNQNGIMAEIGKLRNEAQINAEELKSFQQGLLNLNSQLSNNENSGVQILQGDGALVLVFGLGVVFIITSLYFRNRAQRNRQIAKIFADVIASQDNIDLEDKVFTQAVNSQVEKEVHDLIIKGQKNHGINRQSTS